MNIDSKKTLAEVIENYVSSRLAGLRVMVPGKVEKYYESEQSADVLITLKKKNNVTGEFDNSGQMIVPHAPVHFPAVSDDCGLTMPVEKGTIGMLQVADTDISLWAQSSGEQIVESKKKTGSHEYEDAIFVPGVRPWKRALSFYDADKPVLANGNMKVKLGSSGTIEIEGATEEMVSLVIEFFNQVKNSTVVTSLGSSPFDPASISAMQAIITRMETLKP